ncbi:MAG: YajQ family cyclic di-GMP-binding protein, partial [Pseudomonadota bacterium]
MPSFDVICEPDMHELTNAVDQSSREIAQRFDFRAVDASFELSAGVISLTAENEFQLGQMLDILHAKMAKRKVDIQFLEAGEAEQRGRRAHQDLRVRAGLETDFAKRMVKDIKGTKFKVQAQIQGDQLRVSGKKR